jgi:hypothetical protein
MLPLLISVFAIPISLPIAVLLGPSCIPAIAVPVLAMFSPEQLIIAADAGPTARAAAARAAVANAYFMKISLEGITGLNYRPLKNKFVGVLLQRVAARWQSGTGSQRRDCNCEAGLNRRPAGGDLISEQAQESDMAQWHDTMVERPEADDPAYVTGWTISGLATLAVILVVWVFAI